MLNYLPKTTTKDTIIVSFDVINLYTSIPHEYGLEAIKFWIEKFPNDLPERIDRRFIIEGIKFILQNNYFNFNCDTYRQLSGTAMGTKVAPTYANLVMAFLEVQMYEQSRIRFGNDFYKFILESWKRYLDDCFILWKHSFEQLEEFKTLLNSIHDKIQFTMEYSRNQLPFLDILIIKNNMNIETDIYFKPTDSKQYLLFSSCHPKHTRTNIPFNLARRICTIVSNINTRNKRLLELKKILHDRQYPESLIENGIERAKSINIEELRTTKDVSENVSVLPFISTHNPRNVEVYPFIYQNLPVLRKDPRMKEALGTQKIIKSKRQAKSLKKLLTNAKLPTDIIEPTVKKCGRSNCGICINLIEGTFFEFNTGHKFTVKNNFTCASGNLIYAMKCTGCSQDYIGQTGSTLRKRMTVHRQQIRDPATRMIPLSEHIDLCAANNIPQFRIFPLYQFADTATEQIRINKENLFIRKYRPKLNRIN